MTDRPSLRSRLAWVLDPGESLGRRAANAGVWAFALNIFNRLIVIIRTLVLAALLDPMAFGLVGVAILAIEAVNRFTRTGFNRALVQREGDIEGHIDVAWTVEVIRGFVLALILAAGAPLAANFFQEPEVRPILIAMSIGVALNGLVNGRVVLFDRRLEFQKRFVYRAIPNVIELVVAIALGITLRNAWALAIAWVAGRAGGVVASYLVLPERARLHWDATKAKELLSFSIWLFASEILLYLTFNLDNIVVGRVAGITALGLYQLAYTISQMSTTEITTVANEVAFPTYSRLQRDHAKLGRAYSTAVRLVALASFPVAGGIWFLSEQAVRTLLNPAWLPMIPALHVLIIWGLIRSLLATTGPLFQGIGRPDLATKIQFAQLTLLALVIYPATSMGGIVGAAWAAVLAAIVPDTVAVALATRLSHARASEIVRNLVFPLVHTLAMLGVLTGAAMVLPDGALMLAWAPFLGVVVYSGLVLASRRLFGYISDGLLAGVTASR